MKKMMFFMGMLALGMSSCQNDDNPYEPKKREDISLSRTEEEMVDESTNFAFRFFQQINASEQKEPNWMVSPLSASMALGMVTNGASGNTLEEMKTTLGFSAASIEEMNAYYQKLTNALLNLDNTTQLGIANSIWIKDDFEVKAPFVEVNQQMYDAQVELRDFTKASTIDDINRWCADKTNNCIPKVIDEISEDARMFLLNALYFKGTWKEKFKETNTKKEPFTNADGSIGEVMMMKQTENFAYMETEDFRMAELPYGNGAFSMVILLPAEGKGLDESLETLNQDDWKAWMTTMTSTKMQIKLPRFELKYKKDLIPDMQALGMNDAFNRNADFSAISTDPLLIGLLQQDTYIKVNEDGTEAAAVTTTGFVGYSNNLIKIVSFHVNRPFAYIIKEKSTGIILFMGKVTKL